MSSEVEGNRDHSLFSLTKPREMKHTYFWCKLAEERIKIFRVMRLRGIKQICILSRKAERNVAQILLG